MKNIGITQRVEHIDAYGEVRDCLDQRWTELLSACKLNPVPIPTNIKNLSKYVDATSITGIILSGGNDLSVLNGSENIAPERDKLETQILTFCQQKNMPILGVCRGMQMIARHFGCRLKKIPNHVNKQHIIKYVVNLDKQETSEVVVNSYHAWGIPFNTIPKDIVANATTDDEKYVEHFEHKVYPITGIMWHPERVFPFNQHDLLLIEKCFYKDLA